ARPAAVQQQVLELLRVVRVHLAAVGAHEDAARRAHGGAPGWAEGRLTHGSGARNRGPRRGSSPSFGPVGQAPGGTALSQGRPCWSAGRIPARFEKYRLTPAARRRIIRSFRGRRFLERR